MVGTTKMEEILNILLKLKESVKKSGDVEETVSYILKPRELETFIGLVQQTDAGFKDDSMRKYSYLACLVVGYHLGINKIKEAN